MDNENSDDRSTHNLLWNGPADSQYLMVLAHGAGQPMDAPFMDVMAEGLAAGGIRVARFEFPYMARRRTTGVKAGPNRLPVLIETWKSVVAGLDDVRLIVGGKSMGGRIASMIADEVGAAGLICLGYPFHPPGKPEKLRTEHLANLRTPGLFCQGERDPFGTREEVAEYILAPNIRMAWMGDGDHGFKPRKKSGRTLEQNLSEAIDASVSFIETLKSD